MFKHQEATATWHQLDEAATRTYRIMLGKRWDDPQGKVLEREWLRMKKLADERLVTGPIGTPEDTLVGAITSALRGMA